jgi:hypothetical protein
MKMQKVVVLKAAVNICLFVLHQHQLTSHYIQTSSHPFINLSLVSLQRTNQVHYHQNEV